MEARPTEEKFGLIADAHPYRRGSTLLRTGELLATSGRSYEAVPADGGFGEALQELTLRAGKLALTDHENPNSSFDALNAPVDAVPAHPPVITRPQVLPFGELTWENYLRLCYDLAGRAERVEHVARYRRSGQAQQGIDLFARMASGKYEVWQAKRYGSIASSDVKTIVDTCGAGNVA